ncbi:MAG: cytochrome c peroxidase [Bacteroidota bacterium]
MKYLLFLSLFAFSLTSCIKDQVDTTDRAYTEEEESILAQNLNLPVEAHDYNLQLPEHLGFSRVNSSKHMATLGRVLFYDKKLSKNESVSCASCHEPEKAFADGKDFSEGFDGEFTKRNSLALGAFPSFNAYYGFGGTRMFWDERAQTVADQSELTIADPIEMGHGDLDVLANSLLENNRYYRILFDKAYPEGQFGADMDNKEKMLQALDAFVSSIGCFNTKFDDGWAAVGNPESNFSNFTAQENMGKQLFNDNCASCHNLGPGFSTTVTSANNGLDANYEDKGMYEITNNPSQKGVFKVPMLRNVALTAPFMHDGRFETLEEVIEHYNTGVQEHPNLHPNLRSFNGAPVRLNLSQDEKDALVAFMHTLTDATSIAHEKYADPFKQ